MGTNFRGSVQNVTSAVALFLRCKHIRNFEHGVKSSQCVIKISTGQTLVTLYTHQHHTATFNVDAIWFWDRICLPHPAKSNVQFPRSSYKYLTMSVQVRHESCTMYKNHMSISWLLSECCAASVALSWSTLATLKNTEWAPPN